VPADASRGRLDPLRKKVAVCGLILFGTLSSTLGKLGEGAAGQGQGKHARPRCV
jgi:hypothetical protein